MSSLGASLIVALAVVVVYRGSLSTPFVFDDNVAVLQNPTIRHLGWSAFLPPPQGGTTTGRPLVNFSYALNYAISGEHVWSYHVANVAIHVLAALTLLGLLRRTFQRMAAVGTAPRGSRGRSPLLLAVFGALLWALHPLQTESVVGVAQRTESLCGFWYLLTLYAFVRAVGDAVREPTAADGVPPRDAGAQRARAAWLGIAWTACLCGMATKEVMVTAPVMVLLYDRTFLAGSFRAAWRSRRWFYAAMAATWLLLAALLIANGGGRGAAAGFGRGIGVWPYMLTQCEAIVRYLKLACWPHPLVLDYGTGVVTTFADVVWQAMVLMAALAATVWALVRKPVLGFSAASVFILLAPSSSFVPLVTQTSAEHRMYLAVAVITAAFTWWVAAFVRRPAWLLLLVLAAFGGLTVARVHDYRDVEAIWTDNVAKRPQVARGHNNLALALQGQGRVAEANAQFARAVALEPGYVTAHYDYGVALLGQGRVGDAIEQLSAAVKLAPDHADAQMNLGNALVRAGRVAEAVAHYHAALRIAPAADAHYDLGVALRALGREVEAGQQFQAAVAMEPALAPAHVELGRMAEEAADTATAEREYTQALRYAPHDAATHARLGLLLARRNRLSEAEQHLRDAVRLAPADIDARANLGNVLLLLGRARDAITCYEEVLRRRPDDSRARENLELARTALR